MLTSWDVPPIRTAGILVTNAQSEVARPIDPDLDLSSARIRTWFVRSGLSVLDQGMTSASGLVTNLLLARWLTAEAYGAFALAFVGFLFVAGFHNVLVLEPMSVIGPAHYRQQLRDYFGLQLRVHFVLVVPLAVLLLVAGGLLAWQTPHRALAGAVMGSGIALPFLLLQWLGRRMSYVLQKPTRALLSSTAYFILSVLGLFVMMQRDLLSPLGAFLAMAFSSLVASLLAVPWPTLLRVSRGEMQVVGWVETLQQNWGFGRWLAASTVLSWVVFQAQTFLVAGFLGLGDAGVLRAMQLPSLVMTQTIGAIGFLVLPSLSQEYGQGNFGRLRKKASLTSLFLGMLALGYAGILFALATPAEQVAFGGKYAHDAWLIPVLSLVPVAVAFGSGSSMMLRALRRTDVEFKAYAASAAVSLTSAVLFMNWWAVAGAAASAVLGAATLAAVTYGSCATLATRFHHERRPGGIGDCE